MFFVKWSRVKMLNFFVKWISDFCFVRMKKILDFFIQWIRISVLGEYKKFQRFRFHGKNIKKLRDFCLWVNIKHFSNFFTE